MNKVRNDWSKEEILRIYDTPLIHLIHDSASLHRKYHELGEVQVCSLISIKTGSCPEDCSYCPQSARYNTEIDSHNLMKKEDVVAYARQAKENGATRVCMGAAWRNVRNNAQFEQVLESISAVKDLGVEVCATLGMVNSEQASRLKDAGLYAYNHNIDSSEDFYKEIISTRKFEDRINTLNNVRDAGLSVCCGGIIGMGESKADRISFLHTLATMPKHPESVPINALVPVKGTPLEDQPLVPVDQLVRVIATARILMPASVIRLSAGRKNFSASDQALCFIAGANSIFAGEKLLTTPNNLEEDDRQMFDDWGLSARPAYKQEASHP